MIWPWKPRRTPQISLLVPYRADRNSPDRANTWKWLKQYWGDELPEAEIVMGSSPDGPFSKTAAVNDAASRAKGRVFVILDADTYMPGTIIRGCANVLDQATTRGQHMWFIPFRHLYRLTEATTRRILASDPTDPLRIDSPPNPWEVDSTLGSLHGLRYGAMIQIMPREAFELVGGMDPRFAGWGGEDVAFVRALDSLWGKHKSTDNDVLHMWHVKIGSVSADRMWDGQLTPRANEHLATRYNRATGDREKMRALVDEGFATQADQAGWFKSLINKIKG